MRKMQFLFGDDLRDKLLVGVEKMEKAVGQTMGARGRNVLIEKPYGSPHITNDGVTIAKEIALEDRWEDLGAQALKQAAIQTNEEAGDGTTCATVLGAEMIRECIKAIKNDPQINPVAMRQGMEKAKKEVLLFLQEQSEKVKTKKQVQAVAKISSQDEELGALIGEMMFKIGVTGAVDVQDGDNDAVKYEILEGAKMDSGYHTCHLVRANNDKSPYLTLENARILITKDKLQSPLKTLKPLLDDMVQKREDKLVILADDYAPETAALLSAVAQKVALQFIMLRPPLYGTKRHEFMEDLAALVGDEPFSEDKGRYITSARSNDLPLLKKVKSSKNETIFIVDQKEEKNEKLERHINDLLALLSSSDSAYESELLKQRLANLQNGVATIKVSAPTETDANELKYRVEDAIHACRSAMEKGILPGGGVALRDAADFLLEEQIRANNSGADIHGQSESFKKGRDIVIQAIKKPFKTILINAGLPCEDGDLPLPAGFGYDVSSWGDEAMLPVNMIERQIIDPTKVIEAALTNAVSIAGIFITTEAALTACPDEKGKTE